MKLILGFLLTALVAGATYLNGAGSKKQPNLRDGLATANAATPTPTDAQNVQPNSDGPTRTPPAVNITVDPNWRSPTPSGDLYAPREGWPIGGYGPVVVTPNVQPDQWQYPMFVTPCWGWIDANSVLFCVTSTPAPPTTPTPEGGYPFPATGTPAAYP